MLELSPALTWADVALLREVSDRTIHVRGPRIAALLDRLADRIAAVLPSRDA